MSNIGIDQTFVHRGIRQDDLRIIESIAKEHDIDFEWVKTLLESYHDKKIKNPEMEEKEITRLIEEHLNKINK